MPYCPVCRLEYRPGVRRCPDCGAALVAALPPDLPPPTPRGRQVLLGTVYGEVAAKLLQDRLRFAGIASRVQPAGIRDSACGLSYLPTLAAGSAQLIFRIYVWEQDLQHARRLYQDFEG